MTATPKLTDEAMRHLRVAAENARASNSIYGDWWMTLLAEHAALRERVAELQRELATWKQLAEYSCEQPAPRCDCAGCSLAREDNEDP